MVIIYFCVALFLISKYITRYYYYGDGDYNNDQNINTIRITNFPIIFLCYGCQVTFLHAKLNLVAMT